MDEREAMDRLRAADPAADAQPDDARLAELVAARRSEAADTSAPDEPAADHGSGAPDPSRADELAARRRPRRWLPVAAAVAGALAIGTAGYGIGRSADDPPAPQAVPALADTRGEATIGSAMPETMAMSDIAWGGSGRMNFLASGLSDEGGTAEAWAFDAAGTVGAEAAARAAAVFGLEGEPRQEPGGGGWMVGSPDGTGPFLSVFPDGTATVSYHDPALYSFIEEVVPIPLPAPEGDAADSAPENLARSGAGVSGTSGGPVAPDDDTVAGPAPGLDAPAGPAPLPGAPTDDPGAVEPEPGTDTPTSEVPDGEEPGPQPTAVEPEPLPEPLPALPPATEEPSAVEPDGAAPEGAAGTVYETLAALGLDPEAAEYETSEHWAGEQVAMVTAHLLVGGERAGVSWHAEVVDGAVYSFSGPLAPLVPLGEYDVVSPAEAAARLSDPRFGHSDHRIAAGPQPMIAPDVAPWGTPPAPPPAPGAAVPWRVREVTLTGADLALTTTYGEDGVALLLPAYSLTDTDGGTWTVLALAEHELAF